MSSTSKAKIPISSSSKIKNTSTSSGSKLKNTMGATQASGVTGSKQGGLHVYFEGRDVTPQSLAPTIDTSEIKSKKGLNGKPYTIDESHSDLSTKMKKSDLSSKFNSVSMTKSRARMNESAGGFGLNQKPKVEEEYNMIILSETPTDFVFSIPAYSMASDTRDAVNLEAKNNLYEVCIKNHQENLDSYYTKSTQTRNRPLKNQQESAAPPASVDFGAQAISYEIKDEVEQAKSGANEQELLSGGGLLDTEDPNSLTPLVRKYVQDTVATAMVTPGCLLDTTHAIKPPQPGTVTSTVKHDKSKHSSTTKTKTSSSTSRVFQSSTSESEDRRRPDSYINEEPTSGNNSNHVSTSKVNASVGSDYHDVDQLIDTLTEEESQILVQNEVAKQLLSSPALHAKLLKLERAVQQNAHHRAQLDYRDLPNIEPLHLLSSDGKKGEQEGGLFGSSALGQKGGFSLKSTLGDGLGLGGRPGARFGLLNTDEDNEKESDSKVPQLDERVRFLFRFLLPNEVKGRSVTAMAWNEVNPDLLAVGYGKLDDPRKGEPQVEASGGLVLFWSLRNPAYPERIIRTNHPVTSIAFSIQNPTLLAVGQLSGELTLYDAARTSHNNECEPVESSAGMEGGHLDPVWALKWVPTPGDGGREVLVSLGGDGRVLRWSRVKGFTVTLLMQLKKSAAGEGWISTSAGGICFDFPKGDPSTYVVGAEDGSLSKCAVAYNEQALDVYQPHAGPVYQLKFNPRWPSLFLTCSADWTASLFHLNMKSPLLTFRVGGSGQNQQAASNSFSNTFGPAGTSHLLSPSKEVETKAPTLSGMFPITDISWCQGNSTVFSCVTVDGKAQLWDLSVSSLDPIVQIDFNSDFFLQMDGININKDEPSEPQSPHSPSEHNLSPSHSTSKFNNSQNTPPINDTNNFYHSLTTVLLGTRDPIMAVGDNQGRVTILRVVHPHLFLPNLGPKQQYEVLRTSLLSQIDPSFAQQLQHEEPPKGLW